MDEAGLQPLGDEVGLPPNHSFKESGIRMFQSGKFWIVAPDGIVGEGLEGSSITPRGSPFKSACTNMTGGYSRQDSALQLPAAENGFSGGSDSQTAGGRDGEGMHGFAYDVFPEHGAERCPAIPTPGERRQAGTFKLDIKTETL